jgi:hypothetical protein
MDPYIEASGLWGDFHGSMVVALRDELNARLPKGYAASIELYVWLHEPDTRKRGRRVEPDVFVTREKGRVPAARGAATVSPPAMIVLPAVERKRRKYVAVMDLKGDRVVTVIELLSPANKDAGDDRDAYLTKRGEYLGNKVNLVEIDLLRGGQRLPLGDAPEVSDYYVMVCRAWECPEAGLWTFSVRHPLPEVPVPLAQGVPDVLLPLRPCFDRAYDGGRYADRLAYDRPLLPRMRKADAAWARDLLAGRSR